MIRKFFIFLLFVTIWSVTTGRRLQRYEQRCIKETGVNRRYILKHRDDMRFLLYNPPTRCYVACVFRRMGTMKNNGHLNIKQAVRSIPKDHPRRGEVAAVYKRCAQKRGGNPCQTSFQITRCLLEDEVIRDAFHPKIPSPAPRARNI